MTIEMTETNVSPVAALIMLGSPGCRMTIPFRLPLRTSPIRLVWPPGHRDRSGPTVKCGGRWSAWAGVVQGQRGLGIVTVASGAIACARFARRAGLAILPLLLLMSGAQSARAQSADMEI